MTREDAIAIATEFVRADAIAENIDFGNISAMFMDGNEIAKEIRRDFPNTDPSFKSRDCWMVDYPLLKNDEMLRESIGVTVDDRTGKAHFDWVDPSETE